MTKKKEDGGYIAIRGFAYQFDKALLDMLQHPDKGYQIENLQDHNYEDYAIQVKYYDREYKPSERKQKIKAVLINFLNDLSEHPERKYCLYSYFNGVDETTVSLSFDELNDYLGNKKAEFDEPLKRQLVKDLKVVYAPDFKEQFGSLIHEISKAYTCDKEDACCYHAMMVSHIERLVLQYKVEQAERRACSKTDLDRIVTNAKDVIFRNAYVDFLGREKFHKHIHKQYFNRRHITAKERIFIIEPQPGWGLYEIRMALYEIASKWGKNKRNTPNEERCSPFFHVRIDEEDMKTLKTEIRAEGKSFTDGHYFKNATFDPDLLVEPQTRYQNYDMLFIDKADDIVHTLNAARRAKEIIQFYHITPLDFEADVKHIKIQIDRLEDIEKMI
jgi:hypothetical protein